MDKGVFFSLTLGQCSEMSWVLHRVWGSRVSLCVTFMWMFSFLRFSFMCHVSRSICLCYLVLSHLFHKPFFPFCCIRLWSTFSGLPHIQRAFNVRHMGWNKDRSSHVTIYSLIKEGAMQFNWNCNSERVKLQVTYF